MDREKHNLITRTVMGVDYNDVHRWLDETFPKWKALGQPYRHHIERHNFDAIHKKYGINSPQAQAAMLHVMCARARKACKKSDIFN